MTNKQYKNIVNMTKNEASATADSEAIVRKTLKNCGVALIDVSCDCTKCQPERFWSHRVTGGNRGSQAAIIRLKGGAPA